MFRRRSYKTELPFVSDVCRRLDGDLIPDDESVSVSCIVPEKGLSLTYLGSHDYYIFTLTNGEMTVSVTTRERPDFFFSGDGTEFERVEIKKPDFVKAFRLPDNE